MKSVAAALPRKKKPKTCLAEESRERYRYLTIVRHVCFQLERRTSDIVASVRYLVVKKRR